VWIPVVEGLRRRGWEVTTTLEEETLGYTDTEHLQYAAEQNWTLLTFDDDFLSLVETSLSDINHEGIIFISQHGHTIGELVQRIDRALLEYKDRTLTNEIIFA